MPELVIRSAERSDLPRLTEIYNYYVVNTAITFDLKPFTIEERLEWFGIHRPEGRYRLLVAEQGSDLLGFASTGPFRAKQAYETTVEISIYCAPEATNRRIGTLLYTALFEALHGEDVHRLVAGITLPNDASIALHKRFSFTQVGVFTENGRKLGRYWSVAWFERPLVV